MDTLDSLRDGGRVVGVVSHVAEMRDRIPAQLRVAKSRDGLHGRRQPLRPRRPWLPAQVSSVPWSLS